MCRAIRTWMIMAHGEKSRSMVTFGTRARWKSAGPLTVMDTGTGLARGAGLGSIMNRGGLRHFTTVVGRILAAPGDGARDLFMSARSTDQRSLALSAGDLASVSVAALGGGLGGFRWDSANRSDREGVAY